MPIKFSKPLRIIFGSACPLFLHVERVKAAAKKSRIYFAIFFLLAASSVAVTGCNEVALRRTQEVDRADYSSVPPQNSASASAAPVENSPVAGISAGGATDGSTLPPPATGRIVAAGSYLFTTPTSVTLIRQSNPQFIQYVFYFGRPPEPRSDAAPTALQNNQTPFLTITVEPDPIPQSGKKGTIFSRIQNHREYLLNNLQTEEWSGYTSANLPFTELICSHGKGDKLHAIAVAKNAGVRKAALQILASIHWQDENSAPADLNSAVDDPTSP